MPLDTKKHPQPRREAGLKQQSEDVEKEKQHLKAVAKRAYLGQKKQAIDEAQIVQFLPMVHKIAQRVVTYLKPSVAYEDLVSAGTIGLVKAARDYDASFGAEFKTYAYTRVKGAILDELRSLSLLPTNVNEQVRKTKKISQEIYRDTGRFPTDSELAGRIGISVEELYETFANARTQHFLSIEGFMSGVPGGGEFLESSDATKPGERMEKAELVDELAQAIRQLSEKQRQVVLLYYQQELTMKQIADVLEISEPRVSQIHAAALFNLSLRLSKEDYGG